MDLAMHGVANTDTLNPWCIQVSKQKGGFRGLLYVNQQEVINPPEEPQLHLAYLPLHQGLPLTEVQLENFWHGGEALPALQRPCQPRNGTAL